MIHNKTSHASPENQEPGNVLAKWPGDGRVRTLLVDDHAAFLDAVEQFVTRHPQIEIVGRASNGLEALESARSLTPDLILMDLTMPQMGGIEATRQIKAATGSPKIVILTLHDLNVYQVEAKIAGADGFVAKSEFADALPILLKELFQQHSFDISFLERTTQTSSTTK